MPYSIPQIEPGFVKLLMKQEDPELVQNAIVLYTIGLIQGMSCMLREHAMSLLLQGFSEAYVDGWLDVADTFDLDPPPRESHTTPEKKEG